MLYSRFLYNFKLLYYFNLRRAALDVQRSVALGTFAKLRLDRNCICLVANRYASLKARRDLFVRWKASVIGVRKQEQVDNGERGGIVSCQWKSHDEELLGQPAYTYAIVSSSQRSRPALNCRS